MRCAVHTLQLAIHDGLKARHVAALINSIRVSVVAARSLNLCNFEDISQRRGAIFDQVTGWDSTNLTFEHLLELKPALVDTAHPDVSLFYA